MRFERQEDGNYLDTKTGLIWKEYPEYGDYTWAGAKSVERDGWRLPTITELKGIVSKKRHGGIYTRLPNMLSDFFWAESAYAWHIGFNFGYTESYYHGFKRRVRLVK